MTTPNRKSDIWQTKELPKLHCACCKPSGLSIYWISWGEASGLKKEALLKCCYWRPTVKKRWFTICCYFLLGPIEGSGKAVAPPETPVAGQPFASEAFSQSSQHLQELRCLGLTGKTPQKPPRPAGWLWQQWRGDWPSETLPSAWNAKENKMNNVLVHFFTGFSVLYTTLCNAARVQGCNTTGNRTPWGVSAWVSSGAANSKRYRFYC